MRYETIVFSCEAGIARLTLNRPERLNAFTVQMHQEVMDALSFVGGRVDARVLLLTGSGRGFCAGQDLAERDARSDAPFDLGANIEAFYNPLVRRITTLELPVVCAVNGVAAGAGANIALACDIVIAKKSARFLQSFAKIGLLPDSGGTWLLPRLAGQARAVALAMTGEALEAERAAEWGMIWKAVEDERFEPEVEALIAHFAAAPTRALAAIKQAMRSSATSTMSQQLDIERDLQRQLGLSNDYREGIDAFKAKRAPDFRGN